MYALMKVSQININNTRVWLSIQQLYSFRGRDRSLTAEGSFLCYFNFSAPIFMMEGELILDENKLPKIFSTEDEISLHAMKYIKKRLTP
jgi:hypothetical protein